MARKPGAWSDLLLLFMILGLLLVGYGLLGLGR
jgi:hypothetical protein